MTAVPRRQQQGGLTRFLTVNLLLPTFTQPLVGPMFSRSKADCQGVRCLSPVPALRIPRTAVERVPDRAVLLIIGEVASDDAKNISKRGSG